MNNEKPTGTNTDRRASFAVDQAMGKVNASMKGR